MELKAGQNIYFMGIAGTGMAAVAGLCKAAGYRVMGSDGAVYPPMSTMLENLGIEVLTPYQVANVRDSKPDLVVIANSLSRGHPELEYCLSEKIPYTSFAELVGEAFLKQRTSMVVSGTHGKTTTTSLLAHVLHELGEDPSFVVGGVPRNFPQSFRLGQGSLFVIEGDEYDTAFFDKESKFLHYFPDVVLFNNLEFDHADIFADLAAIERMFKKLLSKLADPGQIVANVDDPGVAKVLAEMGLSHKVFRVASQAGCAEAELVVQDFGYQADQDCWYGVFKTPHWGTLRLQSALAGRHNIANMAQVLGSLCVLKAQGLVQGQWQAAELARSFHSFKGVKRRLDHLGHFAGVDVYEDFAHHPTAVEQVIKSFRLAYPHKRLLVAFEPRNASSRRNVFSKRYEEVLKQADVVLMGACPVDPRIPEEQRMRTDVIARGIGPHAVAFADNQELLNWVQGQLKPNDAIIFMSSGSFSGIPQKLVSALQI